MKDTTSTPRDPDGGGALATGEDADAAATTMPSPSNGAAGAAASGSSRPSPVERPTEEPGKSAPRPDAMNGSGADPAGTEHAEEAPRPSGAVAAPAGGTPTVQTRLPAAGNGSAGQPGPSGAGSSSPRPGPGESPPAHPRPVSADHTRPVLNPVPPPGARPPNPPHPSSVPPTSLPSRPAPAPGPPPGPGPSVAAPPPWARVPGYESDGPDPDRRSHDFAGSTHGNAGSYAPTGPVGGLLDEGPTTFLEAPRRTDEVAAGPDTASGGRPVRATRGSRPPRQAALQLKRLDPWSMLKLGLVLAVVLFFVWMVTVGVLYGVLDGMGVWDRLNGTYADLVAGGAESASPLISAGSVFAVAAVIGAVNSLLFAVAVTIGAFVYNVTADLVGGIEVTLSERD